MCVCSRTHIIHLGIIILHKKIYLTSSFIHPVLITFFKRAYQCTCWKCVQSLFVEVSSDREAEEMTWARFERSFLLKMHLTVSVLEDSHVPGTHVKFTRCGVKDGNCPNI